MRLSPFDLRRWENFRLGGAEPCSLVTPAQNVDSPRLFPFTFPGASRLRPPCFFILHFINIPELLAFWEVDLRLVHPSPHLAAWRINPLFAANLGVSAFWLAAHQAKRTWFGNFVIVVLIYSFTYLVHSFVFVMVPCVFPP